MKDLNSNPSISWSNLILHSSSKMNNWEMSFPVMHIAIFVAFIISLSSASFLSVYIHNTNFFKCFLANQSTFLVYYPVLILNRDLFYKIHRSSSFFLFWSCQCLKLLFIVVWSFQLFPSSQHCYQLQYHVTILMLIILTTCCKLYK